MACCFTVFVYRQPRPGVCASRLDLDVYQFIMWDVFVFHVALWGPVTELGRLVETDDFATCVHLGILATQANYEIDPERELLIYCKRIEE